MRPIKCTTFAAVCSLVLLLAAPGARGEASKAQWNGAAPNSGEAFRFIVVSDNTGSPVHDEWKEAVREINLLKPDFVISVGDFIGGYTTNTAELTAEWDAFDADIRKLDAPFYYCPGNHDISNPAMQAMWIARYGVGGKSYYSFDYRNCHFVVLDNATPMFMSDYLFTSDYMKGQLAWLAKDLAAAGNAKHVFVFYHVPLPQSGWGGWREFVKLFPGGKTTVFNGHFHQLSYSEYDGIPTYVLGPTGALSVGAYDDVPNRELGMFRMFAQVAVDNGTPAVVLLPLHEVLPGDYVLYRFSGAFIAMTRSPAQSAMSLKGGMLSLKYHNSLTAPFRVSVSWDAPEWDVRPPAADRSIPPGKDTDLPFILKPRHQEAEFPSYKISYETTDPAGRKVSYNSVGVLSYCAELDIPRVKGISVDGDLRDWKGVKPYELKSKGRLVVGAAKWKGPKDNSARIYLGHDSQRLYACVDVTDDQIAIDDKYYPNWNDGIEFFWDSRPPDKQDGKHGIGTGQVILALPPENQKPLPLWFMGNRPIPKGLVAVATRGSGGYIYEFSVPLSELGVKMPVVSGQPINLEFHINDRDIINGQPACSVMSTSGQSGSPGTANYARCKLK